MSRPRQRYSGRPYGSTLVLRKNATSQRRTLAYRQRSQRLLDRDNVGWDGDLAHRSSAWLALIDHLHHRLWRSISAAGGSSVDSVGANPRHSSGSFATLAAIRRASSLVSNLAGDGHGSTNSKAVGSCHANGFAFVPLRAPSNKCPSSHVGCRD